MPSYAVSMFIQLHHKIAISLHQLWKIWKQYKWTDLSVFRHLTRCTKMIDRQGVMYKQLPSLSLVTEVALATVPDKTGIVLSEKNRGWIRPFSAYFCLVLASSKPPTPLHTGPFTTQICTDLRGVKNPREIGGNPPIGGKEQCLQDTHAQTHTRMTGNPRS